MASIEFKAFDKAYEFATKDRYGNLLVDFNPKLSLIHI